MAFCALDTKKIAKIVLLYVSTIAFPASLFGHNTIRDTKSNWYIYTTTKHNTTAAAVIGCSQYVNW